MPLASRRSAEARAEDDECETACAAEWLAAGPRPVASGRGALVHASTSSATGNCASRASALATVCDRIIGRLPLAALPASGLANAPLGSAEVTPEGRSAKEGTRDEGRAGVGAGRPLEGAPAGAVGATARASGGGANEKAAAAVRLPGAAAYGAEGAAIPKSGCSGCALAS